MAGFISDVKEFIITDQEGNTLEFKANSNTLIYQKISSKEELDSILVENDNSYHQFILEKQSPDYIPTGWTEKHHIIPLGYGGPDESWNIITLSFDDHTHAHELLSKVFDSKSDKYVVLWRKGLTKEAQELQRQYAKTRSVFLDPEKQSIFGRRGGRKRTEKRHQAAIARQSIEVKKSLSNGTLWLHIDRNIFITILGGQCRFLRELTDQFLQRIPNVADKNNEIEMKSFREGLSKVIQGFKWEHLGFYLIGIVTEPFISLKNFHLERYYKSHEKKVSKFSNIETVEEKWKAIGSDLGNRS